MEKRHVDDLKGIFWLLLNVVMVFVLMLGIVGMGAIVRSSEAVYPARTITVSGSGDVEVSPDIATVTFSVVSQGSVPALVQEENTSKINKVIEFVKSKGIESKDIKTTGYDLRPYYDYSGDSPRVISGYELRQMVTIKMRDLEGAPGIIGGLTARGVNEIQSLAYSVEDPEAQKNVARAEAFGEAYEKAMAMANQNGVRLAKVVTFSENGGGGVYPEMYYKSDSLGLGGDGLMLEAGSEKITVNVSVTYEIK